MNIAIIGSNRGIGLALAKYYASKHTVYAFCRQSNTELEATGAKVIEGCEVSSLESLKESAQKVGNISFDLFVHVSGIWRTETFDDLNEQTMLEQFKINSIAPLSTVKAFENSIAKGSKIALVTSRMGSIGDNHAGGRYGYRMSKAALNAGGKSLAIDLKEKQVCVFLIHPGYVQTDMTNNKGDIAPTESAKGIAKILEEKSLKDTGSFWHVNGQEIPW